MPPPWDRLRDFGPTISSKQTIAIDFTRGVAIGNRPKASDKVMRRHNSGFLGAGHLPTLLTAFLYFDFTFAVWVLNGALAPFIAQELGLSHAEKGYSSLMLVR